MSPETIFNLHLILGYVAWLLLLPRSLPPAQAQVQGPGRRATRHRYSAQLSLLRARSLFCPASSAICPLALQRSPPIGTWPPGVLAPITRASHGKGTPTLFLAVRDCFQPGGGDRPHPRLLPRRSDRSSCDGGTVGLLAYVIPIIYVPLLMITHIVSFYLLARPQPKAVRAFADAAAA